MNVLDVIDGLIESYDFAHEPFRQECKQARAAVAELIEAHKELRARYVSLFDLYQRPTYHESSSPDDDLNLALARTDAALAKVQP